MIRSFSAFDEYDVYMKMTSIWIYKYTSIRKSILVYEYISIQLYQYKNEYTGIRVYKYTSIWVYEYDKCALDEYDDYGEYGEYTDEYAWCHTVTSIAIATSESILMFKAKYPHLWIAVLWEYIYWFLFYARLHFFIPERRKLFVASTSYI